MVYNLKITKQPLEWLTVIKLVCTRSLLYKARFLDMHICSRR